MTIPANPHRRALWNFAVIRGIEPLVKFLRIPANVSLDRARDLQVAALPQNSRTLVKVRMLWFFHNIRFGSAQCRRCSTGAEASYVFTILGLSAG